MALGITILADDTSLDPWRTDKLHRWPFQNHPHAEERSLVIISVPLAIMHRIDEALVRPTENIGLIFEQGREGFYHINLDSDYPLATAKKTLLCMRIRPQHSFYPVLIFFTLRGRRGFCPTVCHIDRADVLGV